MYESVFEQFVIELNNRHGNKDYYFQLNLRGRKYTKVELISYGQLSVHAFLERSNGKVIKPASYNQPQKKADGSLAYRYDLSTVEGFAACVAASDRYGSYLYQR
jgi:hypothetical protein